MNRELIEKYRTMDRRGSEWLEVSEQIFKTLLHDFKTRNRLDEKGRFIVGGENNREKKYVATINRDETLDIEECFFDGERPEEGIDFSLREVVDIVMLELLIPQKNKEFEQLIILSSEELQEVATFELK